jgi:hypothetical protein
MLHRLPPVDREPEIGDLCRLNGPEGQAIRFRDKHGVGMIVKKHLHKITRVSQFEIKWLKSEEHMRFFKDDLTVISDVD